MILHIEVIVHYTCLYHEYSWYTIENEIDNCRKIVRKIGR